MKIGMIAPEFPPERGGMQVMAFKLATLLSEHHAVTVFAKPGARSKQPFEVKATLTGLAQVDLRVLEAEHYDCWLGMNAGYAAIAHRLQAPLVTYFHGNDFLNPWAVSTPTGARALRKLGYPRWHRVAADKEMRIGIGHVACILTNSSHTKQEIEKKFPGTVPVICPPGVDPTFYQHREAPHQTCVRLLSVCRLAKHNRRKNIEGVLRAISLIKEEIELRYTVIGAGDDLEYLKRVACDLDLSRAVDFAGSVSDAKLLESYRTHDLFVLAVRPDPVDTEGFGIVYLEANASGMPVLCTGGSGTGDSVCDGVTGIVLSGSRPADIAEGIRKFAARRDLFDSQKLQAFSSRFRWETTATIVEDALRASVEARALR